MKKTKLNAILSALICTLGLTAPLQSSAQITFTETSLKINGLSTFGRKSFQISNFGGVYWTAPDTTHFFQLDITPENPRLAGTNDNIVLYNTDTRLYNTLEVSTVYSHSDARAKTNVKDMSGSLDNLMKLRPVSYNWITPEVEAATLGTTSDSATATHAYGPTEEADTQYGFLAQEVEQIIPDIVKTSDTGDKLINYTALIPMLVESVQELNKVLEQQEIEITNLSEKLKSSELAMAESGCKIVSCTPNPTSGFVTVETALEEGVESATLIITSMAGNREKLLTVTAAEPKVNTDVASLPAGIHLVSLYVGNRLADSCRLIKQ